MVEIEGKGVILGGGEEDEADGYTEEEGEIYVMVLWRGIELDWDTLMVEEQEGPRERGTWQVIRSRR
jgi:hypothetical protein